VDRSRLAELVLSCVLPADRAAAVTGDFLEEAGSRGRVWFWSSILRTIISRVKSDFLERPLMMIRVGGLGFLRNALFPLLVYGLLVAAVKMLKAPDMKLARQIEWPVYILWPIWIFMGGRWAGRKARGCEAAAAVAVAGFGWMAVALDFAWLARNGIGLSSTIYLQSVWHDAVLIAGALWARYRDVRQMWRPARGS
jgi:hypothetical protein